MSKFNIKVDIKHTEALTVFIGMMKDIQEMIEFIPDHIPEKARLHESLHLGFRRIIELVETDQS